MGSRKRMGDVYAEATFYGPGGRKETLRLLVDTGSTLTWIPGAVAKRLGIRAAVTMSFDLGRRPFVRRRIGEAPVEILGRRATRQVVFARPGEDPVIGHETLQGLLLHVDEVRHRLVPGLPLRAPGRRLVGTLPKVRTKRAARA